MGFAVLLILVLVFAPESLWACAKHVIPLDSSTLKSPATILFNTVTLLALAAPFGFAAGRLVRRHRWASRALIFAAVVLGGGAAVTTYHAWACHGTKAVGPFLNQVHDAQVQYHKVHGTYASSFDALKLSSPTDRYSYFLPAQSFVAKKSRPKETLHLRRLPKGIKPAASAKEFRVVALGFTEPDRIDIWTFNQNKEFEEWSTPAFSEAPPKPSHADSELMWSIELINRLETPLMVIALIIGLTLGFTATTQASARFLSARL